MARQTTQSAHEDRSDSHQISPKIQGRFFRSVMQICLAYVILASLWQLLGPEPESKAEYRTQTILVCFAYVVTAILWIGTSEYRFTAKFALISLSFIICLTFGVNSVREFDASFRVLEPARVRQGRIVHEAIGLSYSLLPNLNVQLQPTFKRDPAIRATSKQKTPSRLRLGDVAAFRHLLPISQNGNSDQSPTMIVLEIQNNPFYDIGHLTQFVRTNEEKMVKSAEMQIVKSTHQVRIANLDMVEYELVKKPRNILARTVYLRAGKFLLNFMLLTENESDCKLFDELLNSIRLQ